jgi:hypothetical protein
MEKQIRSEEQTILIDEDVHPPFGVAEAVAHLDLNHHDADAGALSEEEHRAAVWLAKIRLDAQRLRPPEMADAEEQHEDD